LKKLALLSVVLVLTGCPMSTTQRGKVAQAADTVSVVVLDFQQGEVISHGAGLITDDDHLFIQRELLAVSRLGKTTDACILSAADSVTTVGCLKSEMATIDQINSEGSIGLKSVKARADFQTAMLGAKAVINGIYTALGGK